ncbi:HAD superfamily hydrolase (TIGR01509 family)/beta-phosphoglucomutase family hydrolase [Geothermobacter ehrlichii]|uniref:Beta-phosphoglucomutase n=1 Tax=Geothermobacter ehrlichii TaxID=213224 RepID=A0A5D3WFX5_9BACT|nr:beta-phosphoglucomutase family hydrolase [Geothermobacter ehrlichii]TYO95846.1 HAD superfamily hydrolase (TIGR01509 family)/beta-phosphoglucomutase family hydrolase [Geothermobacter ehrlichii]
MDGGNPNLPVDWGRYRAVLFDLDGVLTATAKIHAICWKRMFDSFLKRWAAERKMSFEPFDSVRDYHEYVDGRLRYDGVRSFLASRGIELPDGSPDDSPERETVCGLGNRKDAMVGEILASERVDVFEGSIRLVRWLRQQGLATAVVSASKNCPAVLRAAGIEDLFDQRIDGHVASDLGLPGKPAPDTYLKAAELLSVPPAEAVVVEDAISGIEAGRNGGFGLVIGVDRQGDAERLAAAGADIVVRDLVELLPESLSQQEA